MKVNLKKIILITGGAGYVGSNLIRDALALGYRVRCFDRFVYGGKSIVGFLNHPDFETIKGDVRNKSDVEKALEGNVDSIVHLAAIVGDLPCQAAPKSTYQINFQGTQLLADLAKKKGIKRFIFTSTCSNYGVVNNSFPITEMGDLNPISLYAETKIDCEKYLMSIASEKFHPVILRFGTAYGISFRTRFDLLVNSLVYEALKDKEIMVFATNMWRPYVHVADMARIILKTLKVDISKVSAEIFNAGATSHNFTKDTVVKMLSECLPEVNVHYTTEIDDKRNYRVDCSKLEKTLDFTPIKTVQKGIQELIYGFESEILNEEDYNSNNIEHLKYFFGKQERILSK